MKKTLLLVLLSVLMVLSACNAETDKPTDTSKGDGSMQSTVKVDSPNAQSSDNKTTGSDEVPESTVAPTPEPMPTPTPFPADDVKEYDSYGFTYKEPTKLYNEPDEGSYVHTELVKDSQLRLTGKYGDEWYRVDYNGVTGYIKRADVAISKAYINADEVRLREGASRSKDIIKELSQQTQLVILSHVDDWYRVVLLDESFTHGYVSTDYVSYYDAYVTAEDVRLREEPNTECETITRIEQGKRVSIICEYNGWYKIAVGEYRGFMSKDYVEYSATVKKVDKERGYINDNGVNFREGPSTECHSMGRLAKFAPVYITGETDEWYRVTYNDEVGFVSKDFVEKGKLVVYVTGQDVNLRSGPGTGYDLLTKVRQNSVFEITGSDGDWLKGVVNHNTGYILSDYLSSTAVNNGEKKNEFSSSDIALAAKVVYLEARGKGTEAYRAVANVIYNRVKSHRFPNTVRGVVYESGQFSVIHHSKFDSITPSSEAYNATKDVLNGGIRPMPFNVLFFHADYLGRNWGSDKEFYKSIGGNSFFRYVG